MHHGNIMLSQKSFEIIIIKIHIAFVLTGKEIRTKISSVSIQIAQTILKLGPRLNWMSTVCYRCGGAPDLSYTVSRISQTTPQSSLYCTGCSRTITSLYLHTQAGLPTLRGQRLISRHACTLQQCTLCNVQLFTKQCAKLVLTISLTT